MRRNSGGPTSRLGNSFTDPLFLIGFLNREKCKLHSYRPATLLASEDLPVLCPLEVQGFSAVLFVLKAKRLSHNNN